MGLPKDRPIFYLPLCFEEEHKEHTMVLWRSHQEHMKQTLKHKHKKRFILNLLMVQHYFAHAFLHAYMECKSYTCWISWRSFEMNVLEIDEILYFLPTKLVRLDLGQIRLNEI